MRVSDSERFQRFTTDVQDRLANLMRIQQELGTGRSLFEPSEHVLRADRALRSKESIANGQQLLRNIEDGRNWVSASDSRLQDIVELINQIDTLAISANNSSQNEDDRRNLAVSIDQKIEELLGLANASSGDRYLFGGHSTVSAPFAAIRNEEGHITGVSANEQTIAGRLYRRIAQNEDVPVNVAGTDIFQPVSGANGDQDLFYVVCALRDTIANNNQPPPGFEDTRANEYLRERLSAIRERIATRQTELGAIGQRLEQAASRLEQREVQLTEALEQAQGVDMAKLASRLAVEEGAYNGLLAISSRLLQKSLIDYLG